MKVERFISDFYIYKFDPYLADLLSNDDMIGIVGVRCLEHVIFPDHEFHNNIVEVEKTIHALRSDKITLTRTKDNVNGSVSWDPSLEERFKALYFEGLI